NLDDEELEALKKNGGVVGVTLIPTTISKQPSLKGLADHIIYIYEKFSPDIIAIGTDFFGLLHMDEPEGLEDITKFSNLWTELLNRGLNETDIEKIAYRNALRVVVGHTRIDKVTVTGQYSLEIKLKEPFAPFLRGLASIHSAIISPLAFQKYGTGLVDEPAGTGPFKFVKWNRGESLILQRFDEYWDQKATIKELVSRFIPEAASREAALLAGDVDIAVLPPASDVTKLRQDSRVKVYTPPTQRIIFITLNTQWGPLKDARVRQALNYAVDKNAIVEKVVFGLATQR
ncbi:MAG: ABC transporter substrate-binding protein, partial [Candidatus Caldarchaeum sp.]